MGVVTGQVRPGKRSDAKQPLAVLGTRNVREQRPHHIIDARDVHDVHVDAPWGARQALGVWQRLKANGPVCLAHNNQRGRVTRWLSE